jgi:DNA polymerase-4
MSASRHILFIDPPAFCTTLEGIVAPALRERPLIVAAPGADRATVLALSAEARRAGITRGMAVSQARKRCPDLIVRPPNPGLYARASRALHQILARYAPIIEPRGYGHAFLDVTGTERLLGRSVDIAWKIHAESRERLRLPLAVGVAQNKLVSQAASEVVKGWSGGPAAGRSDGRTVRRAELLEVPVGTEAGFLAPEPVALLPDLDERMRERLDDYQLDLIGEIQAISDDALARVFGPPGRSLGAHARGIDPRPVLPAAVKAEFRVTHTLGNDSNDIALLHRVLRHLTERLGARLRARQLSARRLTLQIAYVDYATARRSLALSPAALDIELLDAARRALALARTRTVALRAVSVTVDRFVEVVEQFELFGNSAIGQSGDSGTPRRDLWATLHPEGSSHDPVAQSPNRPIALQQAFDQIRTRWGARAIGAGTR